MQKMCKSNKHSQTSLLGDGPAAGQTGLVMPQHPDHKGGALNGCHFSIAYTELLTAPILLMAP